MNATKRTNQRTRDAMADFADLADRVVRTTGDPRNRGRIELLLASARCALARQERQRARRLRRTRNRHRTSRLRRMSRM